MFSLFLVLLQLITRGSALAASTDPVGSFCYLSVLTSLFPKIRIWHFVHWKVVPANFAFYFIPCEQRLARGRELFSSFSCFLLCLPWPVRSYSGGSRDLQAWHEMWHGGLHLHWMEDILPCAVSGDIFNLCKDTVGPTPKYIFLVTAGDSLKAQCSKSLRMEHEIRMCIKEIRDIVFLRERSSGIRD